MVRQFALSEWNLFTTRAELIDGTFVVAHDCDLSIGEAETRGPPTAQWELQANLGYTVRSMEWGRCFTSCPGMDRGLQYDHTRALNPLTLGVSLRLHLLSFSSYLSIHHVMI